MNYRERMKEYLKEPNEYSSQYGKWAILNREQRDLIKRLLREMDSADEVIKHQYFEIERLNNIINEINSIVEYWGYDKEYNDISSFRMAMKSIKDILGSDKE